MSDVTSPSRIRPFYWSVRRELWEHPAIYIEMNHDVRIIRLSERGLIPDAMTPWMGDSVGWWEGNYSLPNALSGARAEEARTSPAKPAPADGH